MNQCTPNSILPNIANTGTLSLLSNSMPHMRVEHYKLLLPCFFSPVTTIQLTNWTFKITLEVLAFLPGEGDLVLVNCLINVWQPRKFFTGSQESSSCPKPFQCTRYSTLPFLDLLPRIRSTYKINV